ncbi:hypothetical protein NQ318_019372 [Aromia moschata]|uniref:Uncharacterized protein n=1 Tax=Aromia moschata TaxID=1265417 RepID=A0AAV8XNJ4_9CUCU|nr:hypothetical protein NQ318_019372 [Aromia moschata]
MYYLLFVLYFFNSGSADFSPNYFCADMNPQPHIIIQQLMGIWYGVEKIDHMEERHYRAQSSSCPIIHISEDRPPPTVNPLYRHYNYTHVYGTGQGYGTPLPSVGRYQPEQHQTYTGRDRQTTYSNYPEERRHRGLNAPNNPEMSRRIRK